MTNLSPGTIYKIKGGTQKYVVVDAKTVRYLASSTKYTFFPVTENESKRVPIGRLPPHLLDAQKWDERFKLPAKCLEHPELHTLEWGEDTGWTSKPKVPSTPSESITPSQRILLETQRKWADSLRNWLKTNAPSEVSGWDVCEDALATADEFREERDRQKKLKEKWQDSAEKYFKERNEFADRFNAVSDVFRAVAGEEFDPGRDYSSLTSKQFVLKDRYNSLYNVYQDVQKDANDRKKEVSDIKAAFRAATGRNYKPGLDDYRMFTGTIERTNQNGTYVVDGIHVNCPYETVAPGDKVQYFLSDASRYGTRVFQHDRVLQVASNTHTGTSDRIFSDQETLRANLSFAGYPYVGKDPFEPTRTGRLKEEQTSPGASLEQIFRTPRQRRTGFGFPVFTPKGKKKMNKLFTTAFTVVGILVGTVIAPVNDWLSNPTPLELGDWTMITSCSDCGAMDASRNQMCPKCGATDSSEQKKVRKLSVKDNSFFNRGETHGFRFEDGTTVVDEGYAFEEENQ